MVRGLGARELPCSRFHHQICYDALVAGLGDIEALTLILHGTRDGAIPVSSPRLLKNSIPRSFRIYVYDAAHAIEVDQPDYFAGLVEDFLKRGEAFLVNPGTDGAAA